MDRSSGAIASVAVPVTIVAGLLLRRGWPALLSRSRSTVSAARAMVIAQSKPSARPFNSDERGATAVEYGILAEAWRLQRKRANYTRNPHCLGDVG